MPRSTDCRSAKSKMLVLVGDEYFGLGAESVAGENVNQVLASKGGRAAPGWPRREKVWTKARLFRRRRTESKRCRPFVVLD